MMDARAKEGFRLLGSLIWLASILAFIFLLCTLIIVLFYGLSSIVPNILASGDQAHLFLITPMPISYAVLEGYWFVGWFVFIFISILLSFIVLFYRDSKPTWKAIKQPMSDLKSRLGSKSAISMIAQLFLALLFFNFAFVLMLGLFGVEQETPSFGDWPSWRMLYDLANASVYEEIITRILFIGIPLFLVHFALGVPMKGRSHKYLLGGGFELGRGTIFLLIFSSSMFSVAHVFSWDLYKIPTTFLAGLALGYLYLRKGIFASILLHFSFNYLSATAILIQDNLPVAMFIGLISILLAVLGSFFFIFYVLKIYYFFSSRPLEPAPVVQEKKLHFICPRCGGMEARYSEGAFECLNCGSKR
jgi:hypothetical protein